MTTAAIITLILIALALVLFVTEVLSIDLVAIGIMALLVATDVITLEQGLAGFGNPAVVTVAFMFIISTALLQTGALQFLTHRLSKYFVKNHRKGLLLMMLAVALISAIVNNTPVVAVFIPVVLQIAHRTRISPSKLLIPLSFASIMGGMLTLFGTSTNLLVNGIAQSHGLESIGVFEMTLPALVLLALGLIYMTFIGFRILPARKPAEGLDKTISRRFLTEIEIVHDSELVGSRIMDAQVLRLAEMDVLEVRRGDIRFSLPTGDMVLKAGDILKTRCSADKIDLLKNQAKVLPKSDIRIGDHKLGQGDVTTVEMVMTSQAELKGQTLRDFDFRRRFRAAPIAIAHREEVVHENLYDVELRPGDVILADVKTHFIPQLKQMEGEVGAPFAILTETESNDFDRIRFWKVLAVVIAMVAAAASGMVPIALAAILAVVVLVLLKCISMKEAYGGVNWKIIFLLAGVLSLGTAMQNTGLDVQVAQLFTGGLSSFGPIILLSVLYLVTAWLTEVISNNATAALMAPIAISIAASLGLNPMPFLIAVMFAASASFMTPIGYQTNTMVYSAGQYRFTDFFKVGIGLNIIFWLVATFLIPFFFPF